MTATSTAMTIWMGLLDENVDDVWALLNSARSANFDDFSPSTLEQFKEEMERRAGEYFWTIRVDRQIVGFLAFKPHTPVSGQFHGFAVSPELRRQGIGFAAMSQTIDWLSKNGFRSFLSMPFADNFAIKKLLLKLGFVCTGTLPGATQRDGMPLGVSVFHLYKGDA